MTAVLAIINKVYDSIGFNEIKDEELRHLVVGRICSGVTDRIDESKIEEDMVWDA